MLRHCGGLDFKQQVGSAYVANDRYPGPGKGILETVEYFLDPGCFAICNHLYHVFVGGVHVSENGLDVFYGRFFMARCIADMGGGGAGVDCGGSGNKNRLSRRRDSACAAGKG